MRIVILGAGVVGTTTAYYLSREGHEVEVLDAKGIAEAASGVNAGLLVPGDSTVWAAPQTLRKLPGVLFGASSGGIVVKPAAGFDMIPWGLRFLRECTGSRNLMNVGAAHRLSRYSYLLLQDLALNEGIEFGHQQNGMVFLFSSENALASDLQSRARLMDQGEKYESLSSSQLAKLDAAFGTASKYYPFARYSSSSGHGDCRQMSNALASRAVDSGAKFHLKRSVTALRRNDSGIICVETNDGDVTGDAYVLAAGSGSADLARTIGLNLFVTPAKGYSVTVPISDSSMVPFVGGVVEDAHVAFSRTATHLRVSSGAEFSGATSKTPEGAYDSIRATSNKLFPNALDWDKGTFTSGLRPMTPRGTPLIGKTHLGNLYLNTGHGHLGWTQACGSARILSDLIAERTPEISAEPYSPKTGYSTTNSWFRVPFGN